MTLQSLIYGTNRTFSVSCDGSAYFASNVGIGTTSPDQKLHIVGNYKGVNSSGQGVQIVNTATPYIQALGTSSINDLMLSSKTFRVETGTSYATSERLRIDSDGRLLVGTTSALEVGGAQHLVQVQSTSAQPHGGSFIRHGGTSAAAGAVISLGRSRGTAAGNVTAVADADTLGYLLFSGSNGTDFSNTAAWITAEVDGDHLLLEIQLTCQVALFWRLPRTVRHHRLSGCVSTVLGMPASAPRRLQHVLTL